MQHCMMLDLPENRVPGALAFKSRSSPARKRSGLSNISEYSYSLATEFEMGTRNVGNPSIERFQYLTCRLATTFLLDSGESQVVRTRLILVLILVYRPKGRAINSGEHAFAAKCSDLAVLIFEVSRRQMNELLNRPLINTPAASRRCASRTIPAAEGIGQ